MDLTETGHSARHRTKAGGKRENTMTANKIFYDTYYPHPEGDEAAQVVIVLRDARIYTIVSRRELFDRGMFHGCFIESRPSETQREAKAAAMRLTHAIGARRVSPDEFEEIEKAQNAERVARAFATAEAMIARG